MCSWRISRISCNIADHIYLLKSACGGKSAMWERVQRSLCWNVLCLWRVTLETMSHSILLRFRQNQNYFTYFLTDWSNAAIVVCKLYVDKLCIIYCAWGNVAVPRETERDGAREIDLHHHVTGACTMRVCGRLCRHGVSACSKHM